MRRQLIASRINQLLLVYSALFLCPRPILRFAQDRLPTGSGCPGSAKRELGYPCLKERNPSERLCRVIKKTLSRPHGILKWTDLEKFLIPEFVPVAFRIQFIGNSSAVHRPFTVSGTVYGYAYNILFWVEYASGGSTYHTIRPQDTWDQDGACRYTG